MSVPRTVMTIGIHSGTRPSDTNRNQYIASMTWSVEISRMPPNADARPRRRAT